MQAAECKVQFILSLNPGQEMTDALADDLGRRSHAHLQFVRSISQTMDVFLLTTSGDEAKCRQAVARLGSDARVRFAELDERRRAL